MWITTEGKFETIVLAILIHIKIAMDDTKQYNDYFEYSCLIVSLSIDDF